MPKRFYSPFNTLVLLAVTLGIIHLSTSRCFSADTYTVPQMAAVTLAWDPNEPAPDGYCIYQRAEGQSYDYGQPSWTGSGTSGTVYNLDWDTTYYFVVRAHAGAFQSADSEEVAYISSSVNGSLYRQLYSVSSDRSNPETLDGAVVDGPIYSFVEPITDIKKVEFFIDGVLHQTENIAPYDLSGGSANLANPFDTTKLSQGLHTIRAQLTKTDGSSETVTSEVEISDSTPIETKYFISSSAGENGVIAPGGTVTIDSGASQTFTITGNSGFHIADVLVDGVSIGTVSSYTFNQVAADHTISASYAIDSHTIFASAGANGAITPTGSDNVTHGTRKTYTISPNTGYQVADVIVDGVSIGSAPAYTFSQVTSNYNIHATFTADRFAITVTDGENGKISPSGIVDVTLGESQTFTFTADSGFHVADVQIDGQSKGTLEAYTFANIECNHTLAVTFSKNTLVKIWMEAEDGDLLWPMEISDDENASEDGFIWLPDGTGNLTSPSANAGYAEYHFKVPENGEYFIWGRQISNHTESDSFFVSIDGQADLVWHTKHSGQDVWKWDVVSVRNEDDPRDADNPERFRLGAGAHTLTIKQREDGTKLDRLLITNDPHPSIYELVVSHSPDRSRAALLDGAGVRDNVYAFVEPITDIKRAEFFIDGVLHQTENIAPYDLSGGSANLANPFDTTKLNQGLHTISVQITKTDGSSEIINAEMFVSNSMYRQFFSISSDRSKPAELDWASVDGLMYAFVEPITDIKRAEFFIDGVLHQTENIAPYDLSGGSANLANPFDTAKLSQGSHTISVQITKTDGSSDTIKAKVIVDNPGF